jgi:hypothetical protein
MNFSVFIISIGTNFRKGTDRGHGKSRSLGRCRSSLLVSRLTHGSISPLSSCKYLPGVILFLFRQSSIFVKRPFDLTFFYLLKLSCSLGSKEEALFAFPRKEMTANWGCIVCSERGGFCAIAMICD